MTLSSEGFLTVSDFQLFFTSPGQAWLSRTNGKEFVYVTLTSKAEEFEQVPGVNEGEKDVM
jgi:hypothetical protein